MGELTEARAELARLEKQEQQLVKDLLHIRAAVRTQRTKLEELVRQLSAPINRLPNETLLQIIELSVPSSVKLAGVSRRWRDVILHCPSLWTAIKVAPWRHRSLLKAQVARSAELLLKVEICSWNNCKTDEGLLNDMLDVLIPSAHRWCSLITEDVTDSLFHNLLTKLNHSTYPVLTHVSIRNISFGGSQGVPLFYSGNCPRLQHLELSPYVKHTSWFQVPLSITSLSLRLVGTEIRSVFQHPSFQKLTTLFVSWNERLDLKPDSIHLPLLEKLVCKFNKLLLQAIVAPKLTHLEYHSPCLGSINGDVFNPRTPRFPNVTRLVFSSVVYFEGLINAVPAAFPAARHIDLSHPWGAKSLFAPKIGSITVDHWQHLKSLTVREIYGVPDFLDV